jgi:hypothetical protein
MGRAVRRADGWLQVRVVGRERAEADALLAELVRQYPIATRTSLMRAALRLGLAALRQDPTLALRGSATVVA